MGPLAVLDGLGPAGVAAVAAGLGIGLVGIGALVGYLITFLTSATAERVGADLRESLFGRLLGLGDANDDGGHVGFARDQLADPLRLGQRPFPDPPELGVELVLDHRQPVRDEEICQPELTL